MNMKKSIRKIMCLVALLCCVFALPCKAARPLWASQSGLDKLNEQRTNATYRFYYTDPYNTDKDELYATRSASIVSQLAAAYGLDAEKSRVDSANNIIYFDGGVWFKYKVVDQQEVFDCDVRQDYDWTLYQLYAVSEKNTEPQFDECEVKEQYGAKSLAQSIIPGLAQWNKKQKEKAVTIWAVEAASVAGAIYLFSQDHRYKNKGWTSKAKSYREMGYLAVGVAVGMYVYNLIDAYRSKGAKSVKVKSRNVSTAVAPFVTDRGAGMSLALRF